VVAVLVGAAAIVVAGDQATKRIALVCLSPILSGRLGFGRSRGWRALVLLWLLALACAIMVLAQGSLARGALASAGLGAALGGAASNVVDRVVRGGVVDFVSLGRWPRFNVADAAITCGLALVLLPLG
jgi:signal peptidase II